MARGWSDEHASVVTLGPIDGEVNQNSHNRLRRPGYPR